MFNRDKSLFVLIIHIYLNANSIFHFFKMFQGLIDYIHN